MAAVEQKPIILTDGVLIPEKGEKSVFSAWKIAFGGALLAVVLLVLFKPKPYGDILWFVKDGVLVTFGVTLASIGVAMALGLVVALGRISRNTIVNRAATVYVEIVRGIPLLVQLFYIYYALGKLVRIPDITAAIIAMGICYGAYIGEVFRAGIQSISKGQMEAALALGMTRAQSMRHVILPQAIRIIIPPVGNEFIALLKDSSLVSILAVSDLLRRGREYTSIGFEYFETYTMVALVYLILTLFLSKIVAIVEDWLNKRYGR